MLGGIARLRSISAEPTVALFLNKKRQVTVALVVNGKIHERFQNCRRARLVGRFAFRQSERSANISGASCCLEEGRACRSGRVHFAERMAGVEVLHRTAAHTTPQLMLDSGPVTTAQLTQRSLASFAEHSGPSHPLECGSVLHEVCHSCTKIFGTGHWLSFGWDEADISREIDGEGSGVGDIVGRGPASDHAVVVQAQIEHEDFVSGHDLVGGPVGGFPGGAIQTEHAPRGDGVEREALAQVLGIVEAAVLDASSGLEDAEELFDGPARFVLLA